MCSTQEEYVIFLNNHEEYKTENGLIYFKVKNDK